MSKWVELAERCEQATGPDREIDFKIGFATGWRRDIHDGNDMIIDWEGNMFPDHYGSMLPSVTESLDAITALIERELPGWAWKVGTCSVSDDAWLTPDFNCPMHGDRLKRELGYDRMKPGDLLDVGIDIELRPSGRAALALCAAFCRAMNEKEANA